MNKKILMIAALGGFFGALAGSLVGAGLQTLVFRDKQPPPFQPRPPLEKNLPLRPLPKAPAPRSFKESGKISFFWKACENEIAAHCPDVLMTTPNLVECLTARSKDLGPQCRDLLSREGLRKKDPGP